MENKYEVTEEWLVQINEKFEANGVPHEQRPWQALVEWLQFTGVPLSADDHNIRKIFDWFALNTRSRSQYIGPMYVGAFYFDNSFWPVFIATVLGRTQLRVFDSIKTVPYQVKKSLMSNKEETLKLSAIWADCIDYAYSIDDLSKNKNLSTFCKELLRSGDNELNAAITLLHAERPNPKAIESARMSVEMFLKAFLAEKAGLTDTEARRKIGHDLNKAVDKCLEVIDHEEFEFIRGDLGIFPPIEDRYKGVVRAPGDLWEGYVAAQYAGATVGRLLSGRDVRPTIQVRWPR
jgi:hypothetical protein